MKKDGIWKLRTQVTVLSFADYMTLDNFFGLSGSRMPLWYLPAFLTSFTALLLELQDCFSNKTILFPSPSLCAYCCRDGDTLSQICTWLAPFCSLGFSLNVTISQDFLDHSIPLCFPLCKPSLPSALSIPLTCFISFNTYAYRKLFLGLCPQLKQTPGGSLSFIKHLGVYLAHSGGCKKFMLNWMNKGRVVSTLQLQWCLNDRR